MRKPYKAEVIVTAASVVAAIAGAVALQGTNNNSSKRSPAISRTCSFTSRAA